MPRIDPLKLLTCLKVLLASNGGIRSENEVKRLAGLMTKYSKKLVSKCIYIQILKCTNTELLGEFMGAGGWSLTHMWLSDGIHAMNWPLVQEILELLLLCPVDVQRLRSNTAPKLVKGLCQNGGNEGVRILATKLVEQWLKVVKGETTVTVQTNNHTIGSTTASEVADESSSRTNTESSNNALDSVPKGSDTNGPALVEPPQAAVSETAVVEEDPLALPSAKGDSSNNQVPQSPPVAQKVNNENSLVYQIVVKDGKQVLAKIENSSSGEKAEKPSSTVTENKEERRQDIDEEKAKENKENEKHKGKESENKEVKESSKDKEKSRSSKDKERHKEHKSSSHKSSTSKSSKSSSSSKSKSSHKSRDRDSEKDRESDKEKDKHKSSSRSSSSSNSSKDKVRTRDKDRSSRDKDKDKQKEKDKDKEKEKDKDKEKEKEKYKDKEKVKSEQTEKDKETLSKVTPQPIDKLGKIPKKPKEEAEKPKEEAEKSKEETEKQAPTSITIPSKKASMSIEIRKDSDRPKTVKTYKSQFRSHGLSEEAPPPPSRKGLKKPPSHTIPGTSIPPTLSLNLTLKRSSPPPQIAPPAVTTAPVTTPKEAAPPAEKKLKLDLTSAPTTEKPGAIKLIAPKPKPSTLVESDLFMDALSASAFFKKDVKKRKRRPSSSKESSKEGTTTSPPESPQSSSPTSKPTPLKFYQDTLEEKDDEKMETSEDSKKDDEEEEDDDKKEDEDDIPLKRVKESIEEQVRLEKEEEERIRESEETVDEELVKKPPGPGCGPDGPPGVLMLHRRKGPKKKLTWRPQDTLEDIRYFELDETERVNVTKTFTDMKQMERFNEREAFVIARKLNCEDTMTEQTTWMPVILVDDVPPHPEGNQSKEKKIQAERELTTLKALYFNRHMIPDSPSEPDMDMEQYQKTEPAVIPLDDITGNPDAVNDFTSMPWPDPKGSPPQCMPDEFPSGQDIQMPNAPFNPFMQFGQPGWPMGGPPGPGVPPPNMMPPNMMGGPMGPFNNMNMGPPNMMMGPNPDDMPMNNMNNVNMMQPPFGPPGPNFGPPPNPPNNFNNFGPPPPMNMSPPHMNMNNGPRSRGGNWRSGSTGPTAPPPPVINQTGGNWRPQGPAGNRPNWTHGNNNRICKQYQRGYCRNGNKCNFVHKTFL